MKTMFMAAVGLLISLPANSYAETIEYVCTNFDDYSTVTVSIDTSLKKISINESDDADNVVINTGNFSFIRAMGNVSYSYNINRSTGIMQVQDRQNKALLSPYRCKMAAPQF